MCLGDIDVDSLDQVKKLREDYERALDAAESHRVAYHEAMLDLYRSGTPLREIAAELGLSHQRVHQIVSGEPPRRRNVGRAAGGIGGLLILVAATFGALRLAHAPPFAPTTAQVPAVITMRDYEAVGLVVQRGLNARVIWRRKRIGLGLLQHVYAESPTPGARLTKGSTVTLYVEIPAKHFHCAGPNNTSCPTTYFYKALSSGSTPTAAIPAYSPSFVPSHRRFFGFGGITRPPGGAQLKNKHQLLVQPTAVGSAAIWTAPDWAVRGTCAWLTIRHAVYGGECRRSQPPRHGLSEVVPVSLLIKGQHVNLLWGQVGADVANLNLHFQDGRVTGLPLTDGFFFYLVPRRRWLVGHRPTRLIAHDQSGRTVRARLEFSLSGGRVLRSE